MAVPMVGGSVEAVVVVHQVDRVVHPTVLHTELSLQWLRRSWAQRMQLAAPNAIGARMASSAQIIAKGCAVVHSKCSATCASTGT